MIIAMEILKNSWLHKRYVNFKVKAKAYFASSFISFYLVRIRNKMRYLSIREISFIIMIVLILDILTVKTFNNNGYIKVRLLGWFIRGALLLLSLIGIFSEIKKKDLIETSLFIKWVNHNRKLLRGVK